MVPLAPGSATPRISQPPASGSTTHSPSTGSQRVPGDNDLGRATRFVYGMPVTAAVQPSRSTARARPPSRASTGAAAARSRSSD